MKLEFAALPCSPVPSGTTFVHHEPEHHLRMDSPALEVMTDFIQVLPVSVPPQLTIERALSKMRAAGVRLLFVVNVDGSIAGLVTARDINGEKPVEIAEEKGISHAAITVEMIMTPQQKVEALDYGALKNAMVGHVVETLLELDRQHMLVVEEGRIRGLFSTTQISRALGIDVTLDKPPAHSLADMLTEMKAVV